MRTFKIYRRNKQTNKQTNVHNSISLKVKTDITFCDTTKISKIRIGEKKIITGNIPIYLSIHQT